MPTLLDVRETFGQDRRSADQTEKNTSYQRVFYVTFDSFVTNLQDVLDATGVPNIGDYYIDSGTCATCRSKAIKEQDGSRSQFVVICTYDTASDDDSGVTIHLNPLDDNWQIDISSRDRSIVPPKLNMWVPDEGSSGDWVLKPVRNTAGDDFDPQPTIQKNDVTITLKKNLRDVEWSHVFLQNTVNSEEIEIWGYKFEARSLYLDSISVGGYQERNGRGFYPHTYKIHYRLPLLGSIKDYPGGGWDLLIANMGYNELNTDSTVTSKRRIMISGAPSTVPQPLDKDGKFNKDSEVFLQFKLPESDFSVFKFPKNADE